MKRIFYTLVLLFMGFVGFSQTPQSFKYQSVIRNSLGEVVANQNVGIQLSILEGSDTGTSVYTETWNVTTNQFGLVSLNVGQGTTSDVFATINWGGDSYYLQVAVDISGGTNYIIMGASQLLSVPYALYSNESNSDKWLNDESTIYYNGGNVGVGTSSPSGKLVIKADPGAAPDSVLFEVKDKDGVPLMTITSEGVKIYVKDGQKGIAGGFAVGRYATAKGGIDTTFLLVTPDSTRVYTSPGTKGIAGGFAVGRYATAKGGATNKYFYTGIDSTRIYLNENSKGIAGGFAVGRYATAKGGGANYFNINTSTTPEVINPSEARILWYPLKEAFMSGRVLVESPDSVGQNSWATGFESKSIGDYSQALGYQARAFGDNSTAIGNNANANYNSSYAIGNGAVTNNNNSYALGNNAVANGESSFAMGTGSKANGNYSLAFGYQTVSDNTYSTAMGYRSEANNNSASSMGYHCIANTPYSFAGGYLSKTNSIAGMSGTGQGAISLGFACEAKGDGAVALGFKSKANAPYSSAIGGFECHANAWGSTALGDGCEANAKHSFASGYHSKTFGNYSIASGADLVSNSYAEAIFGRFNDTIAFATRDSWVGTDPLFVIGNGTDYNYRNNAFSILKNGDMIMAKDTFAGEFLRFRTSGSEYDIDFFEHKLFFSSYVNNVQRKIMIIDTSGLVGIGTSNPEYPLHVATSVNDVFDYGYLNSSGVTGTASTGGDISIFAEGRVRAEEFNADSDKRIKKIKGVSNSKEDLELINKIKITDYQYVDTIRKGTEMHKKVIAQELQTVLPNAVTKTSGYIPNIYSKAVSVSFNKDASELTVKTKNVNDLKVGDKIKLIHSGGVLITNVTDIVSKDIFKVESENDYSEIFVFGKEVNDFLTVDYEAISMLNVSATQELIKENEKLNAEIEKLKTENIQIKSKFSEINSLKAEVDKIKQVLSLKASK